MRAWSKHAQPLKSREPRSMRVTVHAPVLYRITRKMDMAIIIGWAKLLHRAKPITASFNSTGLAFDQIGGKPKGLLLMFAKTGIGTEYVEVQLTTRSEVEMLRGAAQDFLDRTAPKAQA
jgi:hypothetical protein